MVWKLSSPAHYYTDPNIFMQVNWMRDLTDTLTHGPFRDDTHRAAVEAGDGRLRSSGTIGAGGPIGARGLPYWDVFDLTAASAIDMVEAVYETAKFALASAGPLPLASTEPWVEDKQAYRERLRQFAPWIDKAEWQEFDIDEIGENIGLPRARLVPADAAMREETL